MDVHENLVKVQRELYMCANMLREKAHALHVLGMNELGQTLQFVANKLATQEEVLHEMAGAYVAEKLDAANAASNNVLQSALAGIDLASQEAAKQRVKLPANEHELRAALDGWRRRTADDRPEVCVHFRDPG